MKKNDQMEDNSNLTKKKGLSDIPVWVHVLVLVVIVGVIAFTVYKLWRWNQGTAETEGVVEGDFQVEVLDQIFLMPEDKKALHEVDDEETILFLGNDVLTYYNDENGFIQQVEKKMGATCINAGFPETTVAMKNQKYSDDYKLDAFSFISVAQSIANQDFTRMHDVARTLEDSHFYLNTQVLEDLDMEKVDTLVIFYDGLDYINMRFGINPNDPVDNITYSGALNGGIQALQEKYPYIRIVCMSFPMCYAYDKNGQLVSGDRFDFGNGRLTTYLQFMIDISGATGVSFVDNYYGTIHEDNSSSWMLDNIHVNAACNEHMAEHFISAIYPELSSGQ